jgi:hypothetical protein
MQDEMNLLQDDAERAAEMLDAMRRGATGELHRAVRPDAKPGAQARQIRHRKPGSHAGSKTPKAKKKAKARAKRKATKR